VVPEFPEELVPEFSEPANRMLDEFKGNLTTSKYAKLAHCSTDTALRDIRGLLERGIIVKNPAGGRSTSYRLAEPDEIPPAAVRP
jgi:Fic family protein